ncbi:hypothetical protein Tco_1347797 [Tanacetum coccineum]
MTKKTPNSFDSGGMRRERPIFKGIPKDEKSSLERLSLSFLPCRERCAKHNLWKRAGALHKPKGRDCRMRIQDGGVGGSLFKNASRMRMSPVGNHKTDAGRLRLLPLLAGASCALSPRCLWTNCFGPWMVTPLRVVIPFKSSWVGFDLGFACFLNTASLAVTYLSKSVLDTPSTTSDETAGVEELVLILATTALFLD